MTDQTQSTSQTQRNAPISVLRDGPVFAKVWKNESEKGGVYYNVTLGKLYTHKETGETRETTNLQKHDLLPAQFLMRESYSAITEMQRQNRAPEKQETWLAEQNETAVNNASKNEPSKSNPPTRGQSPEM